MLRIFQETEKMAESNALEYPMQCIPGIPVNVFFIFWLKGGAVHQNYFNMTQSIKTAPFLCRVSAFGQIIFTEE